MGYFQIHSEKEDTDIQVGIAYYAQWKLIEETIEGINKLDPRLPSSLTLN
jgi:hypothetical protein